MSEKKVEPIITRFPPSPTGFMHIGNLRSCLYGWLMARQTGGTVILRIEDTDKKREVEGGVEHIKKTFNAVGLNWDEEYLQSERLKIYKEWANKLYKKGLAYSDNVTPEEVDAWREDASKKKKPFLYRNYITEDRKVPWKYGSNTLRFKADPAQKNWKDEVRGDLKAGEDSQDDFVLVKSDGYPTYNFAHIVDDHLMGITHIFRSDEFIASTPNYLNLYKALDLTPPKFVTLPPIMAAGGKKKLGKRDGAKDALEYLNDGVLVDALINFISLMGWNDGTEQEIFTRDELIQKFSIDRIGKSGANYDEKRLEWINGHHIRRLSIKELYKLSEPFWKTKSSHADKEYKQEVLAVIQERLKFLSEIPELTTFFFEEPKVTKQSMLDIKNLSEEKAVKFLDATLETMCNSDFTPEDLQTRLNQLLEELNTKPGVLFALIRNVVSGSKVTPALNDMLSVLGKKVTIERIDKAIALLA